MPRHRKCRKIRFCPRELCFKPAGRALSDLETIELTRDELEAVRLADLLGMYQEEAAGSMGVSRQTFGNIINSAHRKLADFLINAKSLQILGGEADMEGEKICPKCRGAVSSGESPKRSKCNEPGTKLKSILNE